MADLSGSMEGLLLHAEAAAAVTTTTCFICLEGGQGLQRTGCACRGTGGFAHLSCLCRAAQVNKNTWMLCPTCGQTWTGDAMLGLCRARFELAKSLPVRITPRDGGDDQSSASEDRERLDASLMLTQELSNNGEFAEALEIGKGTLAFQRELDATGHGTEPGRGEASQWTLQAMAVPPPGLSSAIGILIY
jgi:hypothetical protein